MTESAQPNSPYPLTLVCHECENRVRIPELSHKQKAHCPRCGLQLTMFHHGAMPRMLSFGSAALIFLFLSMPFNFLSFSASGQGHSIDILGGIGVLIEQNYVSIAIIQFLAILALPAMILLGLLYVLVFLSFDMQPPKGKFVVKSIFALLPWSMAEVFLVGTMVSLIKLSSMADVTLGMSFYAYVGFIICMIVTLLHLDKHQLMHLTGTIHHPPPSPCNRSESIQKTWALLATALILYVPANVLPIMNTRLLGQEDPSTILGGIIILWESGSYPIAAIIFIASVLVPVGKMVVLAWLNFSVQSQSDIKRSERIMWYRITEFVGRWSMVDVFVVAILVSLIQLGNTMSIYPGPAALAFCGVVVVTMLAAMTFDSRLIWTTPDNGSVNGK